MKQPLFAGKSHQLPKWRPRLLDTLGGRLRRYARHNRMAVPVITFCVLLAVSLIGFIVFTDDDARATNALVVIVNHDDVEQTVPTAPTTVGELLQKLDIELRE